MYLYTRVHACKSFIFLIRGKLVTVVMEKRSDEYNKAFPVLYNVDNHKRDSTLVAFLGIVSVLNVVVYSCRYILVIEPPKLSPICN